MKMIDILKGRRQQRRLSDQQLAEANPPTGFNTGGWRCSECGAPCYAFGHLHADGEWRAARAPDGTVL